MCTVASVVHGYLCHACGACAAVCPADAISYYETTGGHLYPHVEQTLCASCGLCLQVCPGSGLSPNIVSFPVDPFVGDVQSCYVGRATDESIYANAQSGGVVTALLCHALREELISSALVTTMRRAKPPRPGAHLAKNTAEVLGAQKSKYAPVAALAALRDAKAIEGPIAVVGLPCQVHGLRNLMEVDPDLRWKVALIIGLICERTMTSAALDFLAMRAGVGREASMVVFRDKLAGGYPGNVHVFSNQGADAILPKTERMRIKDYFTPARCRICFDKLNVFSDITVGDPWGIPEANHREGESVVIPRTQAGMTAVEEAKAVGAISLRENSYDAFVLGQKIEVKKREWAGYTAAWRSAGLEPAAYDRHVARFELNPGTASAYFQQKLGWSLSLDTYEDRETLLRDIERRLRKQALVKWPKAVGSKATRSLRSALRRLLLTGREGHGKGA